MGLVWMSKRELNRLEVLARLDGGKLTPLTAADLMRLTLRQTYRLLKRYRQDHAPSITNQRRGQPSNNRLPDARATMRSRWFVSIIRISDRCLPPRS